MFNTDSANGFLKVFTQPSNKDNRGYEKLKTQLKHVISELVKQHAANEVNPTANMALAKAIHDEHERGKQEIARQSNSNWFHGRF